MQYDRVEVQVVNSNPHPPSHAYSLPDPILVHYKYLTQTPLICALPRGPMHPPFCLHIQQLQSSLLPSSPPFFSSSLCQAASLSSYSALISLPGKLLHHQLKKTDIVKSIPFLGITCYHLLPELLKLVPLSFVTTGILQELLNLVSL